MRKPKANRSKKVKPKYKGVEYDSDIEVEFAVLLDILQDEGIIYDVDFHPKSFVLIPKAYTDTPPFSHRKLIRAKSYTPDFYFKIKDKDVWGEINNRLAKLSPKKGLGKEKYVIVDKDGEVWIDTKGVRNKNERDFKTVCKCMYKEHDIYINTVVPEILFKAIGVPDNDIILLTPKTKKPKKKYVGMKRMNIKEMRRGNG